MPDVSLRNSRRFSRGSPPLLADIAELSEKTGMTSSSVRQLDHGVLLCGMFGGGVFFFGPHIQVNLRKMRTQQVVFVSVGA